MCVWGGGGGGGVEWRGTAGRRRWGGVDGSGGAVNGWLGGVFFFFFLLFFFLRCQFWPDRLWIERGWHHGGPSESQLRSWAVSGETFALETGMTPVHFARGYISGRPLAYRTGVSA